MTITFSLTPETEARLRERAAAAGKDVSALIREAIEEKLSATTNDAAVTGISHDRWSAEFASWMNEVAERAPSYPPGYVADDSREGVYEGRGE